MNDIHRDVLVQFFFTAWKNATTLSLADPLRNSVRDTQCSAALDDERVSPRPGSLLEWVNANTCDGPHCFILINNRD
jgi:hypothetical protein